MWREVRMRLFSAFATFLLVLSTEVGAQGEQSLPANMLWGVVQLCARVHAETGDAFPCLEVQDDNGSTPGFALLRAPGEGKLLFVPTRKIAGIESPELLIKDSPNWWEYAWEVGRSHLSEIAGKRLDRTDVAMGINDAGSRSQDQLHIHIGCLDPEGRKALEHQLPHMGEQWAPFVAFGEIMEARWVPGETLGDADPFRLLAAKDARTRETMHTQSLAVIGARRNGKDGFVIVSLSKLVGAVGVGAGFVAPHC
jgi:CDP-diacylglycerol pyrophosphatase